MTDTIITNKSDRFWLILSLSFVHLLLGLDINIVSVSLSSIAEHFQVTAGMATRVVWIYFLILTCFLLGFGKLGDLRGFRKIYLIGISVFTFGSFLSGLSFNFNILILFRVIQALGSAVLFALTPALIAAYIPKEMRGKVFGINYAFTALGGIIGRVLSGYLIEYFGWSAIFFINIPIGLTAIIIGLKYIPRNVIFNSSVKKFDYIGSFLIFIVLFTFLFVVNGWQEFGWYSAIIIVSAAISKITFTLFILYELKINKIYAVNPEALSPLVNLAALKDKLISLPVLTFALVYVITNGMIFLFPFYLLWVKNFDKKYIGILMAIPSLFQMFSGYFAGSLSDKKSIRTICSTGIILAIVSYLMFVFLNKESENIYIISSVILYGIAIGVFIPANTNRIMSFAPIDQKGSISSFMTMVIRLGSAFGVTICGAIFMFFVPQKNPITAGIPVDTIIQGFQYTFIFGVAVCILALVINILIKDK